MQKQVLAYKDITHDRYAVLICWATGEEIGDIKKIDKTIHFADIEEVRLIANGLNGILARWGEENSG